jgi:DNA-binding MarR family transcriptional regulator
MWWLGCGVVDDVEAAPVRRPTGAGFLVAQVGALGSRLFGDRLAGIGLTLPQSALMRAIAREPGRSQQALAEHLDVGPSRLVVLIDELERAGVVERRPHPTDRRQRAVHLTDAGRARMRELVVAAADHEDELCRSLDPDDRARLRELLGRIATDHGLRPGVHPGT